MELEFELNGAPCAVATDALEAGAASMLLDVVRGTGLTGAKEGCGVGVCGACTVLVDDVPVSSCIYLAASAHGRSVWTVEGLTARDPELLRAFVTEEGLQCGVCTPGQVVAAYALRREHPDADEDAVREYMAGNLCRCTGYVTIVASVLSYLRRAPSNE